MLSKYTDDEDRNSDLGSLETGAGNEVFEAYTQHHFKTVSSNINMLACSAYWSTIKTLPATLPEPSSEDHGPNSKVQ